MFQIDVEQIYYKPETGEGIGKPIRRNRFENSFDIEDFHMDEITIFLKNEMRRGLMISQWNFQTA